MKASNPAAICACALVLMAAGGCASSPPSDFYLLTAMAQARPATMSGDPLVIGVGPVSIPDYLDRAQIVTRTGPNRLDVDEFNRWGGSLTANLSSVVAQNLSSLLGTDDVFVVPTIEPASARYRILLAVSRLDGALGGDVTLDAHWVITGPRQRDQLGTGAAS